MSDPDGAENGESPGPTAGAFCFSATGCSVGQISGVLVLVGAFPGLDLVEAVANAGLKGTAGLHEARALPLDPPVGERGGSQAPAVGELLGGEIGHGGLRYELARIEV